MDPDYSVKGIIIIELSIFANFIKQNEVCYSNTICGLLCRKWHVSYVISVSLEFKRVEFFSFSEVFILYPP